MVYDVTSKGIRMNESDKKAHAKARRESMPVRAGRGAGFHKNKKAYTRKQKHKECYR